MTLSFLSLKINSPRATRVHSTLNSEWPAVEFLSITECIFYLLENCPIPKWPCVTNSFVVAFSLARDPTFQEVLKSVRAADKFCMDIMCILLLLGLIAVLYGLIQNS